jgi:type I restriction enzyme S subunit
MGKWKEYTLREICTDISYGYTASANISPVGPKFLRITDIVKDRINWETVPYCEIDDAGKRKYKLEVGDVVIARTGATTGYTATIKEDKDAVFASYLIRYKINRKIADPFYVDFLLRTYEWRGFVDNIIGGSAQPGANAQQFADFDFVLPPLPEQKSIASVLSSLDEKIDLLQRQNKTLEALAETLFRQWVVEEAEEGWETTSLFDVIEIVGGGTPKTEIAEYWNGNIKWISAKDITPNHKGFITDTEKAITELGLENSSTKILPTYATVISARGTVGKYCLLAEDMAFSQSNYGIKPRYKDCYFFTYQLVAYSVDELQASAYGSVFDTITTSTFKEHKVNIPSESEIQSFEKDVKPYFEKMLTNCNQIRTLTRLRDRLLPKLMSGEVRVKAAEKAQ